MIDEMKERIDRYRAEGPRALVARETEPRALEDRSQEPSAVNQKEATARGDAQRNRARQIVKREPPAADTAPVISRLLLLLCILLTACVTDRPSAPTARKVGVLIVSHGSRSETWRRALLDLDARVRIPLLADGRVSDVKSAFMEYTEPSIATRLKEFDAEGFSDVVVVPVFLTVSPHPFDDIPTIIGQKEDPQSLETLKVEGIERYTPRARVRITPLLDFTDILQKNVLRRVKSLSKDPSKEGLVLIAYGDERYEKEWAALFDKVGAFVREQTGMGEHAHGWCGHLVHYDPGKTTAAIEKVLVQRDKAVVIPVLVAHDERFQVKIIGDGIARIRDHERRVVYRPDSILPDEGVERWVKDAVSAELAKLEAPRAANGP